MFRAYTSPNYSESLVDEKYVGYLADTLHMYEVDKNNKTIKSYIIEPESVAPEFAQKAFDLKGMAFNQVKIWKRALEVKAAI